MSEHLVGARRRARASTRASAAGFVAGARRGAAGRNRKTYVEAVAKAVNAIDRRGELLGLVEAYRRLKADLGLMDFSDQIELGGAAGQRPARGRAAGARRGSGWSCSTSTRTPRWPRRRCSARLVRRRAPGHGGRRPQPGDLRLARRVGVQHPRLRRALPRGRRATVPTYPLTVNRRSDRRILEVANRLAAPLYAAHAPVGRSSPSPRRRRARSTTAVFETHARRARLRWPRP